MRHAALESCLASLKNASKMMKVEILALRLSQSEEAQKFDFPTHEPAPDLLIVAIDESTRLTTLLNVVVSERFHGKEIALVGVFGATLMRPLAADSFHNLLATMAHKQGYTYFARTVFPPAACCIHVNATGLDSMLND